MIHASDTYVVAVDGGGSNCRACVFDLSGTALGTALGRSANVTTNFDECSQNTLSTIQLAYGKAGLSPSRIPKDVAYLGLAGANVGGGAKRLEDSLHFAQKRVRSDRDITVQGALGDGDGAVAQTGTGSFFSVRRKGEMRHVGGWGFQLSDDCSGAYLGRKLLRATVAAYDGLADSSALTDEILSRFRGSPNRLVGFIQTATPLDYGSFVPELAEARERGDRVACRIFEAATARLVHILDALDAQATGRMCLTGGVGTTYRRLLPARYATICADPIGNGLDGAFALARKEFFGAAP